MKTECQRDGIRTKPPQNDASGGAISISEIYRLEDAKRRLGWSDSALRAAKPLAAERDSAIGKKARVVVSKVDQKHGSAHDMRRAFGIRWASRVKPATLKLLMRHKSIETTLKNYVAQDADEVADEFWKEHRPASVPPAPPSPADAESHGAGNRTRNSAAGRGETDTGRVPGSIEAEGN